MHFMQIRAELTLQGQSSFILLQSEHFLEFWTPSHLLNILQVRFYANGIISLFSTYSYLLQYVLWGSFLKTAFSVAIMDFRSLSCWRIHPHLCYAPIYPSDTARCSLSSLSNIIHYDRTKFTLCHFYFTHINFHSFTHLLLKLPNCSIIAVFVAFP